MGKDGDLRRADFQLKEIRRRQGRFGSNTQVWLCKAAKAGQIDALWRQSSFKDMAARGWKIIFPAGREGRTLDSLDRRISRSMDSVETIVSNLASLGPGEGRLTASTTALEQDCPVPSLPRQLAMSSLFRSRRGGGKWEEAGRPQAGEEIVRNVGGGWDEYRNKNGR